jgi:hypothetical protein
MRTITALAPLISPVTPHHPHSRINTLLKRPIQSPQLPRTPSSLTQQQPNPSHPNPPPPPRSSTIQAPLEFPPPAPAQTASSTPLAPFAGHIPPPAQRRGAPTQHGQRERGAWMNVRAVPAVWVVSVMVRGGPGVRGRGGREGRFRWRG